MILEAERHGCVREVLVIAAALSIHDPRERPEEQLRPPTQRTSASTCRAATCCRSSPCGTTCATQQRALSGNPFRRLCRTEYLNYLRVREWQDLFSQLRQVAGDLGIRPGDEPGQPDRVHQSVLAGLLSHIGMRDGDSRELSGARGADVHDRPRFGAARKPPAWVMAAELVETNRLWARRVAAIEPAWAERLGAHLVRAPTASRAGTSGAARGDRRDGHALRAADRQRPHRAVDRVDRPLAREMFIRYALVDGEWSTHHAFVARNPAFVDRVRGWRRGCAAAGCSTTTS